MNTHSPNNEPPIHELPIDELTWQALVDGELPRAELRKLVALCDKHPELWKQCAVAFLEDQALRAELGSLARAEGLFAQPSQKKPAAATTVQSETKPVETKPLIASESSSRSSFLSFKVLDWFALAACLVIAFIIGAQSNRTAGPLSPQSGLVQNDTPSAQSRFKPDLATGAPNAPSALVRNNNMTADSTQFISLENDTPKQFDQLRQFGLEPVKTSEGVVPVRLPDGSTALVPVQEYSVQPKGFAF
ncbi:MAG: hypothetical protein U0892_17755 [Pirellulales bacterium]